MTWRIKSVAKFAAASEFDPESEEFNQYLSTVNGDNGFSGQLYSGMEVGEKSGGSRFKAGGT